MTGPEHYHEAEWLLEHAAGIPNAVVTVADDRVTQEQADDLKARLDREWPDGRWAVTSRPVNMDVTPVLLAAQAHATLALVAAVRSYPGQDYQAWDEATS